MLCLAIESHCSYLCLLLLKCFAYTGWLELLSLLPKEYSSYPSFTQSQYSQYYSSSYNSSYMSANSISPSAIPTSAYSLQESSHNINSQSTESLSGRCLKLLGTSTPSLFSLSPLLITAGSAWCRAKLQPNPSSRFSPLPQISRVKKNVCLDISCLQCKQYSTFKLLM